MSILNQLVDLLLKTDHQLVSEDGWSRTQPRVFETSLDKAKTDFDD